MALNKRGAIAVDSLDLGLANAPFIRHPGFFSGIPAFVRIPAFPPAFPPAFHRPAIGGAGAGCRGGRASLTQARGAALITARDHRKGASSRQGRQNEGSMVTGFRIFAKVLPMAFGEAATTKHKHQTNKHHDPHVACTSTGGHGIQHNSCGLVSA